MGGDYLRHAIIFNISIWGGGAIIQGRPLLEGQLLFKEIRYMGMRQSTGNTVYSSLTVEHGIKITLYLWKWGIFHFI